MDPGIPTDPALVKNPDNNALIEEQICAWCGELFETTNAELGLYCSSECSQIAESEWDDD